MLLVNGLRDHVMDAVRWIRDNNENLVDAGGEAVDIYAALNHRQLRKLRKIYGKCVESLEGSAASIAQNAREGCVASLYNKLARKFNSQSSGARLNALRNLLNDKQQSGESIESYVARKSNVLEHRLMGAVGNQELLLLSVVGGISAAHQSTVASILTEPNVTVERIAGAIQERENLTTAPRTETTSAALFVGAHPTDNNDEHEVFWVGKGKGKGNGKPWKKKQHQSKAVFKPQFQKQHGKGSSSSSGLQCWTCGGMGHNRSQCPSARKGAGKGGK